MASFPVEIILFAVEEEIFSMEIEVEDPELSEQTVSEIAANQTEVTS